MSTYHFIHAQKFYKTKFSKTTQYQRIVIVSTAGSYNCLNELQKLKWRLKILKVWLVINEKIKLFSYGDFRIQTPVLKLLVNFNWK